MKKLPKLPVSSARLPIKKIIIVAIAVIALIAIGSAITTFTRNMASVNEQAELDAANATVENLAEQFKTILTPQRQQLQEMARDPAIVAALAADPGTRERVARERQASLDGAMLLRLLPRGADHIDPDSQPPLTYASVDMLRSSGRGEPVPAELHLGGTEREHVVMIQRVPLEGEVVGSLHLSLDPQPIRDAFSALELDSGYVEIRQAVAGGPPVVIAKIGQAPSDDRPAAIASIEDTKWVVAYRRRGATTSSAGGFDPYLLAGIGAILGLGGLLLWRRRTAAPQQDAEVTYTGAIKAILDGAHPGLEQLLPGAATEGGKVNPLSVGLSGDDITQFEMPEADEVQTPPPNPDDVLLVDGGEPDTSATDDAATSATTIDPSIFRSHDVRGIVGQALTAEAVYEIGRALGSEARARGEQTVITARDGRNSSQELRDALIEGLRDSGRDVLDIGLTPSPVLYFATHYLDTTSGVMITGSHNPPEYNGLKIVLAGETLSGAAIQAIRERIEAQDFTAGEGTMQSTEIVPDYIRRISEEIPVTLGNALKVVVDCGNGVPGIVAPHILRAIGHDVVELYCEVDGDFPNHHPDPSQPENLADLIQTVVDEEADIGLAFDGDGDRLGVVDNQGNIIWSDRQMILFARDVLSRNPGAKIIFDVKCSRLLAEDIKAHGGEPIMASSGHSLIKNKMEETGALLAGEMSGHIFFKDRWYGFDDALYCAARLLEFLVNADKSPAQVFAELPGGVATPELRVAMPEGEHAKFMEKVLAAASFDDAEISTIDGLRADFPDSWGLVRASKTTPCLILRFEGDDEAALARVSERFKTLLHSVDEKLELQF